MMMPYLLASRAPFLRVLETGTAIRKANWQRTTRALAVFALVSAGHGLLMQWYWSRPSEPPLKPAVALPTIDIMLAAPVNHTTTPTVETPVLLSLKPQARPEAVAVKKLKRKAKPKPVLLSDQFLSPPKPQDAPASAPIAAPEPVQERVAPPPPDPFIPAAVNADYLNHPDPDYPSVARSRHWEGEVLLKVLVREDGVSGAVEVQRSSGHEALDEAATEAVRGWRFVPAKRGDMTVASWVTIPISFRLSP
jgi:protein TonB